MTLQPHTPANQTGETTMKKQLAWNNDPAHKAREIARMKAHRAADDIVQGMYWERGKGCAVGCLAERAADPHEYATRLVNCPRQLPYLADLIFEGLGAEDARDWAVDWLEAIPVGADLSLVWPKIALWLLADETHGVRRYASEGQVRDAVDGVAELYRGWIEAQEPPAAEAAAWAAEEAAEEAAWEAAWAAARAAGAARADFYRALRDEMLRLLRDAPPEAAR